MPGMRSLSSRCLRCIEPRHVRNGVHRKIEADEPAVQRHFVQGLFHRGAGVVEEVLKQMDVQHGLQGNAATAPGGRGVDGSIAESSRCQGIMASISSKNGSLQVFLLRFIRCASVRPKCFIGPRLWFRGDQ